MYWYVPVYDIWYWISLVSEGYIRGHTGDSWVHTLSSWIFFKRAGPSRFACRGFMHQHMCWTNAHYIRFIDCCLAAPLPVPASARHHDCAGLLGDAAAAGQLCTTRRRQVAEMMFSGLLTSSTSPSQWCIARGEWAFEGLGVQVGPVSQLQSNLKGTMCQ